MPDSTSSVDSSVLSLTSVVKARAHDLANLRARCCSCWQFEYRLRTTLQNESPWLQVTHDTEYDKIMIEEDDVNVELHKTCGRDWRDG
jgi:hypothetical protein